MAKMSYCFLGMYSKNTGLHLTKKSMEKLLGHSNSFLVIFFYKLWHHLVHICIGLSITGLDYWTGLLEWTTGLTFFALKIIFMPSNKICLPVELHPKLSN